MEQFNAFDFYNLAAILHPLSLLRPGVAVNAIVSDFLQAKGWLLSLHDDEPLPLVVSRPAAKKLWSALDTVVPADPARLRALDIDAAIDPTELSLIKNATKEFETVLSAELQGLNTYYVSQQGIYNTADLISRAERALGESVKVIGETATKDFNQAGRCLAFELSTASAFHSTRSVEAVLRKYHRLVKKLAPTVKSPDMAVCINELRATGEDPKVMDVLDNFRDLHRNTTMHADAFLPMPEALRLFDIAKSAINAMADRISDITALLP